MDWWLLLSSFGMVLAAGVVIALVLATLAWIADQIGEELFSVLMVGLLILVGATLIVYAARGGFNPKPAEAPLTEASPAPKL